MGYYQPMTLWRTLSLLVLAQVLTGATVVKIEQQVWGHWGPILPALSIMIVSGIVLGVFFSTNEGIISKRMTLYLRTACCHAVVISVGQLLFFDANLFIALILGLGGAVGLWICMACAGDLALTVVGKPIEPAIKEKGHFREWPSYDEME